MPTTRPFPKQFQPKGTDDYLQAALETAAWIQQYEHKTENGKYWDDFPPGGNGFDPDVMLFGHRCLYSGAAGIGLFFLQLYQATDDKKWLNEATAAADELIATATGPEWYAQTRDGDVGGVIPVPGWAIGYSNGPVGEAFLTTALYDELGDQKYLDYTKKIADDLIAAAIHDEKGLHWSDQEDIVADGGFVFFLVDVYRHTKDEKYLNTAKEAADKIAAHAIPGENGGVYWKLLDLSLIGFPKGTTFPNFSHGTAGTSWMFAILYKYSGDKKYLDLAKQGVEYIKSLAVGDEQGTLIPYQDHTATGPTWDHYYLGSCHGPTGTVLPFRLLYELTGDESYKDWIVRLSRGIIRAGAPEKYSWGYWPSLNLCCGTPGILEHFVDVYELTGDEEFLDYAKRTADWLIRVSTVKDDEPGKRCWYGAWTRTIPDKVVSYTGLYSGSAGAAASLLRLYANQTGKKLTPLFEYEFFEESAK